MFSKKYLKLFVEEVVVELNDDNIGAKQAARIAEALSNKNCVVAKLNISGA